jgi:hypothetical protein
MCGLARHYFQAGSHELSILIHIEKTHTSMLFVQGQTPLMQRVIHPGVNDLVELIAQPMITDQGLVELSNAEAAEILERYGIPEGEKDEMTERGVSAHQIFLMFQASLDKIILETRRSVDFFQRQYNEENVDRIVLTGSGARIKNIWQYFKDKLDDRVEHIPSGPEIPCLTPDTALARAQLDSGFNLLPKTFRLAHILGATAAVSRIAVYALIAVSLLLTAPLYVMHARYQKLESQRKMDLAKMSPLAKRLGEVQSQLLGHKNQLASLQSRQGGEREGGWAWLQPAVKLAHAQMYFENIRGDLKTRRLILAGYVLDSHETSKEIVLSSFVNELQNAHYYKKVMLTESAMKYYRGMRVLEFQVEVSL